MSSLKLAGLKLNLTSRHSVCGRHRIPRLSPGLRGPWVGWVARPGLARSSLQQWGTRSPNENKQASITPHSSPPLWPACPGFCGSCPFSAHLITIEPSPGAPYACLHNTPSVLVSTPSASQAERPGLPCLYFYPQAAPFSSCASLLRYSKSTTISMGLKCKPHLLPSPLYCTTTRCSHRPLFFQPLTFTVLHLLWITTSTSPCLEPSFSSFRYQLTSSDKLSLTTGLLLWALTAPSPPEPS